MKLSNFTFIRSTSRDSLRDLFVLVVQELIYVRLVYLLFVGFNAICGQFGVWKKRLI